MSASIVEYTDTLHVKFGRRVVLELCAADRQTDRQSHSSQSGFCCVRCLYVWLHFYFVCNVCLFVFICSFCFLFLFATVKVNKVVQYFAALPGGVGGGEILSEILTTWTEWRSIGGRLLVIQRSCVVLGSLIRTPATNNH